MLDPNQPCNSNHAKCKKHQDKVIHDYEYTNKKQKKKVKETKKKKKPQFANPNNKKITNKKIKRKQKSHVF